MRKPSQFTLALLATVTVVLSACQHVDEQVAANHSTLQTRWQELAHEPARPTVTLDWPDAVQKLESGNIKLRKARENVQAAEESVRQVARNYIPELTLNTFANPSFDELGQGDLGNTYLFLGSLFNLPNPLHYRATAMQAQLRYLSTQIELETQRRDLQVKLYKSFRKAAQLAEADRQFAALTRLDEASADHPFATQLTTMAAQGRQAWQQLTGDLCDLFGDYSQSWRPATPAELPDIDYATHPPSLDGRNHFAGLQLTKAALQLVGLAAQRQGLLVGEWPQVSVLLSAPPIYQRSAGRNSYLSINDLRISAFAAYSTDFRGVRSLTRKQAARRAEITKHELDVAMQATLIRLHEALALSRELHTRLDQIQRAAQSLHASGDFAAAETLYNQSAELLDQLDELNLSFWVLDDARWNPQP